MNSKDTFHPQSRVWVYQSNRAFEASEVTEIESRLHIFTTAWAAHGQSLKAKGEVRHAYFIVLVVDETVAGASGCSIDASVHFIKEMERDFSVNLFDRMQVAYKKDDEVCTASFNEIGQLLESNIISEETLVFNNLVATLADLDNNWLQPLKESWIGKRMALSN